MKITRLRIENFRSIKLIDIELGGTTVFVGPNDSGKTAILEAVRIALTRRWGQRGTGFTEYDVYLATEKSDPKALPGVAIQIKFEEKTAGEWPDDLQQDLEQLVQPDPVTGLSSITLRASCAWDAGEASFRPAREFLNAARQPLVGASARRTNLDRRSARSNGRWPRPNAPSSRLPLPQSDANRPTSRHRARPNRDERHRGAVRQAGSSVRPLL